MKKKIAIIIPGGIGGGYFNQGIPVLEDYIIRISEHFNVTVFSMIQVTSTYSPKNFRLCYTKASHSSPSILKILLTTIIFLKENKKNNFRLIHGIWGFPSGFLAVVLGKVFRVSSIVSLQGGETANIPEINYGHMRNPVKRRIMLWTFKHATHLTTLTSFQKKELNKIGFRNGNITIIPYGADEKLFTINRKELISPFRFIQVANLNKVKDQVTLLKAFKLITENTDSYLQIIGDGECSNSLKALAKDLNIDDKVTFLNAVPHASLPSYIHQAHILLHTSLFEGQAVVIAEAAASGVVVCGTNVGLITDWGEERCISVECGDYQTLASKVQKLLNDPDKYNYIRDNAHKWTTENTPEKMINNFKEIYNKLIS